MSVDIIGGSLTFRCGHRVGVPLRLSLHKMDVVYKRLSRINQTKLE
jgi:hypothetical protein